LDQEIGAVLQLSLDYSSEIKDAHGTSMGPAHGRIELFDALVGVLTF
jgi:hypothetical protein